MAVPGSASSATHDTFARSLVILTLAFILGFSPNIAINRGAESPALRPEVVIPEYEREVTEPATIRLSNFCVIADDCVMRS